VREPAELAQHERGTLALGQVAEVDAKLRQALAVQDVLGQVVAAEPRGPVELLGRPAPPQHRDRLVVSYAEQPWPQLEVALLVAQGGEGAGHGALHRVARVLVVLEDRPAVAVQRLVMTLVQGRERPRVALRGPRPQHRLAPQRDRRAEASSRHRTRHRHPPCIGNARGRQKSGAIGADRRPDQSSNGSV
jgi:hypothetical protein